MNENILLILIGAGAGGFATAAYLHSKLDRLHDRLMRAELERAELSHQLAHSRRDLDQTEEQVETLLDHAKLILD